MFLFLSTGSLNLARVEGHTLPDTTIASLGPQV